MVEPGPEPRAAAAHPPTRPARPYPHAPRTASISLPHRPADSRSRLAGLDWDALGRGTLPSPHQERAARRCRETIAAGVAEPQAPATVFPPTVGPVATGKQPVDSRAAGVVVRTGDVTVRWMDAEREEAALLAPAAAGAEELVVWFYVDATRSKVGPMKRSVIVELVTRGTLDPSTLVWAPPMAEWKSFYMLPELMVARDALAEAKKAEAHKAHTMELDAYFTPQPEEESGGGVIEQVPLSPLLPLSFPPPVPAPSLTSSGRPRCRGVEQVGEFLSAMSSRILSTRNKPKVMESTSGATTDSSTGGGAKRPGGLNSKGSGLNSKGSSGTAGTGGHMAGGGSAAVAEDGFLDMVAQISSRPPARAPKMVGDASTASSLSSVGEAATAAGGAKAGAKATGGGGTPAADAPASAAAATTVVVTASASTASIASTVATPTAAQVRAPASAPATAEEGEGDGEEGALTVDAQPSRRPVVASRDEPRQVMGGVEAAATPIAAVAAAPAALTAEAATPATIKPAVDDGAARADEGAADGVGNFLIDAFDQISARFGASARGGAKKPVLLQSSIGEPIKEDASPPNARPGAARAAPSSTPQGNLSSAQSVNQIV